MNAATGAVPTKARPGRPFDADVEQRVFTAVLELLRESSTHHEVTTRAIARRAGAGLGTIYRRWSTREELIVAALNSVRPSEEFEPTGDFVADILQIMGVTGNQMTPEQAEATHTRVRLSLADPKIRDLNHARHTSHRRQRLLDAVERGVTAGQITLPIPADHLIDAIVGVATYQHLAGRPTVNDDVEESLRSLLSLLATDR